MSQQKPYLGEQTVDVSQGVADTLLFDRPVSESATQQATNMFLLLGDWYQDDDLEHMDLACVSKFDAYCTEMSHS